MVAAAVRFWSPRNGLAYADNRIEHRLMGTMTEIELVSW
jgi:hypothetical protein